MFDFSRLLFWRRRPVPVPEVPAMEPGFPRLAPMISVLSGLIRTRLWLQILTGMLLGISLGLLLSPEGLAIVSPATARAAADWLGLPGKIFLALIQMIVIALVTCSIILGIAGGDTSALARLGLRIVPYFLVTTVLAVLIGIVTVTLMHPSQWIDPETVSALIATGAGIPDGVAMHAAEAAPPALSIPQQLAAIIPTNPLEAALTLNMFHVVVFAVFIGVAVATLQSRKHAELLIELTSAVLEVSMRVVSWAMFLAPVAVFGLLAQLTIHTGLEVLGGMIGYIATVLLGLLGLLAMYMLIVALLARRNPLRFMRELRELQLLAFSTSSSAAVMPVSINTATSRLGIKPTIARFLIPLGATVNMDGTALYQVIAAIFLTQVFGIDLTFDQLLLLVITTVGASIGAPSTPGVGIVILASIVQSIGVPLSGIALIIGVDRILDMSRTAVNVTGDLVACSVMERWVDLGDEPATPPPVQGG